LASPTIKSFSINFITLISVNIRSILALAKQKTCEMARKTF
jgi:hypothetical protein